MRQFEKLRALRAFRKEHADFLGTQEDRHLVAEIGYHQAKGKPLTLKQLHLLDIGSIATVQRRMRKLKSLGLVKQRQAASDRRSVELTLSAKCIRIFAQYDSLMSARPPVRQAAKGNPETRHRCGLCDSDAGRRDLLVTFFTQGFKRGDRCVLVAPTAIQNEVLDTLPHRRRAAEQLLVSEGMESGDAQIAFYKRLAREARRAGQNLCLAGASWAHSRNLTIGELFDFEKRLDALARRSSLMVLCIYDARHLSGGDILNALKFHRDHARSAILAC